MKERVMKMEEHWERIKDEELSFLIETTKDANGIVTPVMTVGGGDIREATLKALVQQAARN